MKKIIKFLKGISTRKKLSVLIVISLLTITIAISPSEEGFSAYQYPSTFDVSLNPF